MLPLGFLSLHASHGLDELSPHLCQPLPRNEPQAMGGMGQFLMNVDWLVKKEGA